MIKPFARRILQLSLRSLPVSIRDRLLVHLLAQASEWTKFRHGFPTVAGLLQNLKRNGFRPETIIDVGAYVGEWSRMAASIFPSTPVVMIECNPENEAALRSAQRVIGSGSQYTILLLGPEERETVRFYQLGSCSSVLEELTSFEKRKVGLPMGTLDGMLRAGGVRVPTLLKLDVQGFELEVLRGSPDTLGKAEVVILETALLPYNRGAPLFSEVVVFMENAGFVVYDFCGQFRRQTDHALFQTDIVFVKKSSDLRAPRKFYLHEP